MNERVEGGGKGGIKQKKKNMRKKNKKTRIAIQRDGEIQRE